MAAPERGVSVNETSVGCNMARYCAGALCRLAAAFLRRIPPAHHGQRRVKDREHGETGAFETAKLWAYRAKHEVAIKSPESSSMKVQRSHETSRFGDPVKEMDPIHWSREAIGAEITTYVISTFRSTAPTPGPGHLEQQICILTIISGNAALTSSRNILTPPSTPRHTHERQALRELRTAAELSPRRRRVPNPFPQIPRASSNKNIPPSGRSAARAAGQKRRRDRERHERAENTTLPVQRSVTRKREEDDERHMDIDRALSLSPRISSPLNRDPQRPRITALRRTLQNGVPTPPATQRPEGNNDSARPTFYRRDVGSSSTYWQYRNSSPRLRFYGVALARNSPKLGDGISVSRDEDLARELGVISTWS
ncbi:hypothetical protein DFH09DRAFT_1291229 [Mycena vulgaris]|nr:hypothetical protein DFH09DRAFT_1291229 [Mycena vulgaris]